MASLIGPDSVLILLSVILLVVSIGLWMETRPVMGPFGVLFVILFPSLLSGLGVLPRFSSVYAWVVEYFVPLSLPMLLFQADLRRIWKESGRVLLAFLLAAATTVVGALLAVHLADLGAEEGVWTGILTAGFIGGSGNSASVAVAMGKANDPMMGVAVAGVFAIAVPYLAFLLSLPALPRLWRALGGDYCRQSLEPKPTQQPTQGPSALSLAGSFAVSGMICVLATWLADTMNYPPMKFLAITGLSVLLGTLLPSTSARLEGHYALGQILIYSFFVVVGVQINFIVAWQQGSQVMLFTTVLLSVHFGLLVLFGRRLGLTGPEMLVASNACILSPPTAAAMAVSRGWKDLVTPAILCGVLGYALSTGVGIAMAELL